MRVDKESLRPSRAASRPAASPGGSAIAPTQAIARLVVGLRFGSLPRAVVERAKDLVLDHLGVTLMGAQLPWSSKLRAITLRDGGRAESTIYGSRRVPARAAALTNGAAAHAIEFDDTHDESLGHPGCVVIPAAMALAEARDASGRAFLTAMVGGYEAQCRIGAPLGRPLIERGFHPTATCGVFGSAAAAGHLLGLREDALTSAFGSALSMSSGVMQFSEDPLGTMIKRMHGGLPAERGLLAALLAASGFSGPRQAIEGKYGFAAVLAAEPDLARITEGLGERFEIERISIKLYPCCKQFHSLIEAVAECRKDAAFAADEIVAVEPFGPRAMIDTHMEYRPQSTMSAQYSLPYATAAALLLDPTDPASFEASARDLPAIQKLADLVKPVIDERLQRMYPRRFPAGIRLTLRGGRELTATVLDSKSSPERPITREDVQRKFVSLTSTVLSPGRQQRIIDLVARLDRVKTVRELAALLRLPATTPRAPGGKTRAPARTRG